MNKLKPVERNTAASFCFRFLAGTPSQGLWKHYLSKQTRNQINKGTCFTSDISIVYISKC